eukprot:323832-Chlamydomonas_euryale.AAC.2
MGGWVDGWAGQTGPHQRNVFHIEHTQPSKVGQRVRPLQHQPKAAIRHRPERVAATAADAADAAGSNAAAVAAGGNAAAAVTIGSNAAASAAAADGPASLQRRWAPPALQRRPVVPRRPRRIKRHRIPRGRSHSSQRGVRRRGDAPRQRIRRGCARAVGGGLPSGAADACARLAAATAVAVTAVIQYIHHGATAVVAGVSKDARSGGGAAAVFFFFLFNARFAATRQQRRHRRVGEVVKHVRVLCGGTPRSARLYTPCRRPSARLR